MSVFGRIRLDKFRVRQGESRLYTYLGSPAVVFRKKKKRIYLSRGSFPFVFQFPSLLVEIRHMNTKLFG